MSKLRIMIKWIIKIRLLPNLLVILFIYYFYSVYVNAGGSPWQRIIGN